MTKTIPPILIDQVREGKTVLFLGSGASSAAADKDGRHMPTSGELALSLSNRFLNGEFTGYGLARIAELAISETSLRIVQEFIRDMLFAFEPSHAHELIPKFVWSGIATTNYDRLIEMVYSGGKMMQKVVPILSDKDPYEEALGLDNSLILLKLHGCVTRTADENCPFILSPDQYVTHKKGREMLFGRLAEWGHDKPIIFIGQSLVDSDIRTIIVELTTHGDFQPRYYFVAPDIKEAEERLWAHKKITTLSLAFEDFMVELDGAMSGPFRVLAVTRPKTKLRIRERFINDNADLSNNCEAFLQEDVDYVKGVVSTERVSAKEFYRGINREWSAVEDQLDVRRTICDSILADAFLIESSARISRPNFVLIKGHAGSGKSVLMRRLAWDASNLYDSLCIFMRYGGKLNNDAISELLNNVNERVFLFVDRIASRVWELKSLIESLGKQSSKLTIIGAERNNEWNVECGSLSPFVTSVFDLKYLNEPEILGLIDLLEKHHSLGILENKSREEMIRAFKERAGRQLLVALHEATLGPPFEDIIVNEYSNIRPIEAQLIYLTICVLNRFDEPVRAGIISRVHGVPYADFKTRFLSPLEQVVLVSENRYIRDYEYRARHSHIADIVFHRILDNQNERYDVYLKALKGLDLGYTVDSKIFWEMVKAKHLLELFSNHDLIKAIYDAAQEIVGDAPHMDHQRAIYEMTRPNGNLKLCNEYLSRAEDAAPTDKTIRHTRAELFLKMANSSSTKLEKDKYLEEASVIARGLTRVDSEKPYAYVTLLKAIRIRLDDETSKDNPSDDAITKIVKDFEQYFIDAIQRYPTDSYILDEESKVAEILGHSQKALVALHKAFAANPRSSYIALRLFSALKDSGKLPDARNVMLEALESNPNEKRLHYANTRFLLDDDPDNIDAIEYHAIRSYVPGDKNFDAQLIHSRCLFLKNDIPGHKKIVEVLKLAYVDFEVKRQLRYPTKGYHSGIVTKVEVPYCFISLDGTGNWVHLSRDTVPPELWAKVEIGLRLRFRIAFTFLGASAANVISE